jgi:hypothetical protein
MKQNQIYYYILHLLAGITIGFLLFSCKSPKPSCEAYSYVENYKYCIEGKKIMDSDTVDVIAFTNSYSMACDSIFYYNSDSSIQSLLGPYKVYEN